MHGPLEVVIVFGQVGSQPVEQIAAERLLVHVVGRFDDAVAHELRPQAVDNGPRQAAVLRLDDQIGQLSHLFRAGSLGIDRAKLRIQESGLCRRACWLVTTVQFEWLAGKDTGQRVGVGEFPLVHETVVAACAFEVGTHKHLTHILRRLHLVTLAFIHVASPLDAVDEPGGPVGSADQFVHELVVGFVFVKCGVQPAIDPRATAIDEARAAVGVSQHVGPECEPVLGVSLAAAEQAIDQASAFFRRLVGDELFQLVDRWQQAVQIEIEAAGKGAIIDRRVQRHFVLGEIA